MKTVGLQEKRQCKKIGMPSKRVGCLLIASLLVLVIGGWAILREGSVYNLLPSLVPLLSRLMPESVAEYTFEAAAGVDWDTGLGLKVSIPPLPTEGNIELGVAALEETYMPKPDEGMVFASPVFVIASNVEILPTPAKLTLSFFPGMLDQRSENTIFTVVYWNGEQWLPVGGEVDEQQGTIAVEVRHFSLFSTIRFDLSRPPQITEHFQITPLPVLTKGITVEEVAIRLEDAWDLVIEELGYEPPLQSAEEQRIQVWILWLHGKAGEVRVEEDLPLEFRLDDIYIHSWFDSDELDIARVTPLHEFFHLVQINSYLLSLQQEEFKKAMWWMEATGSWMGSKALEEQEYKEYQRFYHMESRSFLERTLDSLEICKLNDGRRFSCQPYKTGVFVRYLEEKYGAEIVKETWIKLEDKQPPLQAIDSTLSEFGSSLSETYFNFALQYGYLRESEWLQKVMELPRNTPEPTAVSVEVSDKRKGRPIHQGHLSGQVLTLTPESQTQGTLKLDFDWGVYANVWRIGLFAEKNDGSVVSTIVASPQAEYEVPSFGAEIKRVVAVIVNTSLDVDDVYVKIKYSIVPTKPTESPNTPPYVPQEIPTDRIAFVSDRDGNKEIYLMELVGSTVISITNLTNNPADDYDPIWSPDGNRIAFISERDGNPDIYMMNIKDSIIFRLTYDAGREFDVAWSPDGNHIAYASVHEGNAEIYVIDPDGSNRVNITNNLGGASPSWSPDGKFIVFSSDRDFPCEYGTCQPGIYKVRLDTAEVTLLSKCPIGAYAMCFDFVWSPDGRNITFTRMMGDADSVFHSTYILDLDSLSIREVVSSGAHYYDRPWDFAWSPDISRVAYVKCYDCDRYNIEDLRSNNLKYEEIVVINAGGSNETRLTNNSGMDSSPAWSPDSNFISFVSNRDGNDEIYVMNADGSNQINLTNNPADDWDPVWSPVAQLPVSTDRIAFVSDRDGNQEIYLMELVDSTVVSLTNLTNNPADDYDPAWSPDGTRLAFRSSRNGDRGIFIMQADGSNVIYFSGDLGDYSWSPDSKQIAFSCCGYGDSSIFVANSDGSGIAQLSDGPNDHLPSWSLDGANIIFSRNIPLSYSDDIYIMNVDGSSITYLSSGPWFMWAKYTLFPDNERISFQSLTPGAEDPYSTLYITNIHDTEITPAEIVIGHYFTFAPDFTHGLTSYPIDKNCKLILECSYGIFLIDVDDSRATCLNCNNPDSGPWHSAQFSWSPDGTRIAFGSGRDGDDEIYIMNVDGSNQVNLTNNPAHDTSPAWAPVP